MDDWVPVGSNGVPGDAQSALMQDWGSGPNGVPRIEIHPHAPARVDGIDDWQPVGTSEPAGPLSKAAAKAPQPQQKLSGVARNAIAGLNQGIDTVLGAPIDLARAAINLPIRGINYGLGTHLPTIPSDSIGGSRSIAVGLGKINPALDPANTVATSSNERLARAAGEGAGMMVAPEAAVVGLGRAGLLAPKMVEAVRPFVGQSAGAGDVAANAAIGATSGTGQGLAQEISPNNPAAALVGGLAGGAVGLGVAGAARAGYGIGAGYFAPMSKAGRERLAAEKLRAAATNPAAAREALENPQALVPGSEPTTFQASGDMGLGRLEQEAATSAPNRFIQRNAEQNAARVQAMQNLQAEGAPEQVAAAVRQHLANLDAQTQGVVDRAAHGAQNAAVGLGLGVTPESAGGVLRGLLEAARAETKQRERALWQAVDPHGDIVVAPQNTVGAAARIVAEKPVSAGPLGSEEQAIHDMIGRYGNAVPLSEIIALRSRLNEAMRAERGANGDSSAYRRLSILHSAIHDDLDRAVAGKVASDNVAVAAGQMDAEDTLASLWERQRDEWLADRSARAQQAGGTSGYFGNGPAGPAAVSGARRADSQAVGGLGIPSSPQRLSPGIGSQPFDQRASKQNQIGGALSESVGNAPSARTAFVRPGFGGQSAPGIGLSNSPGYSRLSQIDGGQSFDQAALGRLNAARQATAQRVATFDNRMLGPMRARPSTSSPYIMSDPTVAGRVFAPGLGGYQAVNTYRQAVSDPAAIEALRGYAVNRLRSTALRADGTLDPRAVSSFRRQYAEALRVFPDLDRQFANAASASRAMADVAAQRKAALDAAQAGTVGKLLGLDSPQDVTRTVGSIFGRQDAVRQMTGLRNAIGADPAGQQGLRKAIVNHIAERFIGNTEAGVSGFGTTKSDTLQTFLRRNEAALKAAGFSDEQIGSMKAVAADLQRANRSIGSTKLPGRSNTAQDQRSLLQTLVAAASERMVGAGSGAATGAGVGSFFGGPIGSAMGAALGSSAGAALESMRQAGLRTVDEIVTDALLDPAKARLLLSRPAPKAAAAFWKKLGNLYLRSAAVTGGQAAQDHIYFDTHTGRIVPQAQIDAIKARLAARERPISRTPGIGMPR